MNSRESVAETHILLQAISVCCNSTWSKDSIVGDCMMATAHVEGWNSKAVRVIRDIQCDSNSFETFIVNPKNQRLFEPTLESHEMIFADKCSRIFHTVYKSSGLISSRDFVTQSVHGNLPEPIVQQLMDSVASTPVAEGGEGFYLASADSEFEPEGTSFPTSGKSVRGTVHSYGYFAIPMSRKSAPASRQRIRVIHIRCVDPRGSIPKFAWEATHKDACKTLDKIAELVEVFHQMKGDTNLKVGSTVDANTRSSLLSPPEKEGAVEEDESPAEEADVKEDEKSSSTTAAAQVKHEDPMKPLPMLRESSSDDDSESKSTDSERDDVISYKRKKERAVNQAKKQQAKQPVPPPAPQAQAAPHHQQQNPAAAQEEKISNVAVPRPITPEPGVKTIPEAEEAIHKREEKKEEAASQPAAPAAAPKEEERPPAPVVPEEPVRSIAPRQRGMMDVMLQLHRRRDWTQAKTLENCLMETCPDPENPKGQKCLRISTEFNCSLETLEAFLADEVQLRKYELTLDTFEVISADDEISTVYTNYKQQTKLVKPRDFCTNTASTLLQDKVAEKEGFANQDVFLQVSVSNDAAKPPQKGYVRGKIHVYGYVATQSRRVRQSIRESAAAGGKNTIKVFNIMRVEPGGSIPKWLIEAAQAENCKKLALIRKLCEQWEKSVAALPKRMQPAPPSAAPPKKKETSQPSAKPAETAAQASKPEAPPQAEPPAPVQKSAPPPKEEDDEDKVTPPESIGKQAGTEAAAPFFPAGSKEDPSVSKSPDRESVASNATFQSCLDEDEFEEQVREMKQFYAPEAKNVTDVLMNLHTKRGWQEENYISGCRVESMLTEFCDKKAVRVSSDVMCTLDAFRATISKVELVRQYEPHLEKLQVLDSPDYGNVIYTSYKSGQRFVSGRDFCVLTCDRLLNEEEGVEAGLFTEGIRSTAFVQSSVNCQDMPEQPNKVRGVVHAFGYIAIATPPEAERIRVFNIGCIDPKGKIPAKLVDAAVGETCRKLEVIKRLAETGAYKAGQSILQTPRSSVTSQPGGGGGGSTEAKYPEIDTAPFFNKLYRLHTARNWSDKRQVGHTKVQVDTMMMEFVDQKCQRFAMDFPCSLATFESFLSSSDDVRKYEKHLESIEFLESPPNATVTYTAFKSTSKFMSSRDFCTMTAQRRVSDEEGCDLGLYTKGIKSEVFVQSAINCKDMPPQEGYVRGLVHAFGYIAIATPPDAKVIRVFHYACVDPQGKVPAKLVDYTLNETASKLTKMAVLCQQRELEREIALKKDVVMCAAEQRTPQQQQSLREAETGSPVDAIQLEPTPQVQATGSSEEPGEAPFDEEGSGVTVPYTHEKEAAPHKERKEASVAAPAPAASAAQNVVPQKEPTKEEPPAAVAAAEENQPAEQAEPKVSESKQQSTTTEQPPKRAEREESKNSRTTQSSSGSVRFSIPEGQQRATVRSSSSQEVEARISENQQIVFDRIVKLHKRTDWRKVSVVEGCLLEECTVPYSDKPCMKVSADFRCSLETLASFLNDVSYIREYDPQLDVFEVLHKHRDLTTLYTSYKQVSKLITPRDFVTIGSNALLSGDAACDQLGLNDYSGVYIQNSGSTLKMKPPVSGYVRGQIHVFGYVATAAEGEDIVRVHNYICADPGGKIPNWVFNNVKAENCKKLALIKQLAEKYSATE